MLFITTGTQKPFDRLIEAVDNIYPLLGGVDIIAQAIPGDYIPKNFKIIKFMHPKAFQEALSNSDLVLAHAGMGTILAALQEEKPILIMPRLFSHNEHRNEHQLATAKVMKRLGYVHVAHEVAELKEILLRDRKLEPLRKIGEFASVSLLESVEDFILSQIF